MWTWSWHNRKSNRKIPTIDLETETKVVKAEVRKFKVEPAKPYVEPTDKEIIEALEFQDNYEAAYLIKDLKKQNAALKGKLTKLKKKSDAYKDDLDRANGVVRVLMKEKHGTE